MLEHNYYELSAKVAKNKIISLLIATLAFLISFNLIWLSILMKISRTTEIHHIGKTIFNLELFLIAGNFAIIFLFTMFLLTFQRFKLLCSKYY